MQTHDTNVFEDIPPKYNIAPTDVQPVVRISRDTGERELTMMRWGLVPYWAKDVKVGFSSITHGRKRSRPVPLSAKHSRGAGVWCLPTGSMSG
jgi:putative SOS response-associated peptidase YedK